MGSQTAEKRRIHLGFLDGIRSLAALFVVVSHAFTLAAFDGTGKYSASLSPAFVQNTHLLCYGYHAVPVFIVLSGFLLMLPVLTSPTNTLSGGVAGFIKRRGRRILPPYYAALILFTALLFVGHSAKQKLGMAAFENEFQINAGWGSIVTHLLLIHNWFEPWHKTIDGPMWSVAAEWQIYLIFALALLPVWRRFGGVASTALGFALGFGLLYLLPADRNFYWTCPWYIGLFAMGMAGASVAFPGPEQRHRETLRAVFPWATVAFVVPVGLVLFAQFAPAAFSQVPVPLIDTIIGIGTVSLMIGCANNRAADRSGLRRLACCPSWTIRLLESRPLIAFAAFSYSFYLLHYPPLVKLTNLLKARHFGFEAQAAVLFGIAVPLLAVASYLFYLLFEKRFQSSTQRGKGAG